jgi:NAD(P)-dependent dehydrogenase (short-subunit alcohol dehydrogenase family)
MPQPFVADLSSLAQIRRLAAEVHSRTASLHGIVQNAGVFVRDRRVSDDGLELTFAVNHLAPFLLTHLLLGLLRESAPARVVVVSSVAHHRGHIDFDDLQRERSYDGYGAYAGSKLANMLFAFELADRLEGTRVTSNALHPGTVGTKLLREGFAIGGVSVAEGAATPVFVASDRSLCEVTGKYFVDRHPARPASATADRILRARLWDVSAAMTGAA